MEKLKIITGGQTGVDRGALDAALEAGTPCGGWCPEGRRSENGAIPARYPLRELPGGGYRERTRRNVEESDATVIIHRDELEGGTALTLAICREFGRPHLVVNAATEGSEEAARWLREFVDEHRVRVLNVAGPRESKWPGAEATARAIVGLALRGRHSRRGRRSHDTPPPA